MLTTKMDPTSFAPDVVPKSDSPVRSQHLTSGDQSPDASEPAARLAIVFGGPAALGPAFTVYELIVRQLQPDCALRESWWNDHDLANPSVRQWAIEEAAQADLIVVALPGTVDPPWMIRAWVEAWSALRAGHTGALVVVLTGVGPVEARPTAVEQYLRAVAQTARLDFFVTAPPVPLAHHLSKPSDAPEKPPIGLPPPAYTRAVAWETQGVARWGLNE